MLFELIFMALCISAIAQAVKLKKLKRRLDSFEVTLRLKDGGNVTQPIVADPVQPGHDCVTNENRKG